MKRIKVWHVIVVLLGTIGIVGVVANQQSQPSDISVTPPPAVEPMPPAPAPTPIAASSCDETLWQHVYHGRFSTPQDRLKVIQDCITVTGTIVNAVSEKDGDFHIRVSLDTPYLNLLNDKNTSGQKGYLVVEPVCENPVSQNDTIQEGVCNGFNQQVFDSSMIGKHVSITGVLVVDQEHGWSEVHPVSNISIIP